MGSQFPYGGWKHRLLKLSILVEGRQGKRFLINRRISVMIVRYFGNDCPLSVDILSKELYIYLYSELRANPDYCKDVKHVKTLVNKGAMITFFWEWILKTIFWGIGEIWKPVTFRTRMCISFIIHKMQTIFYVQVLYTIHTSEMEFFWEKNCNSSFSWGEDEILIRKEDLLEAQGIHRSTTCIYTYLRANWLCGWICFVDIILILFWWFLYNCSASRLYNFHNEQFDCFIQFCYNYSSISSFPVYLINLR